MNDQKFNELFDSPPVPSQDKREFKWLLEKVEALNPKVIAEVGTAQGGSFKFWLDIVDKGGLLVGVDIKFDLQINVPYRDLAKFILGNSREQSTVDAMTAVLEGRKIDFLHLDGGHMDEAFSDYANFSPLVREGGIIAFHDCGEPSNNYAVYWGIPIDPNRTFWLRGGSPYVKGCFESIYGKTKERLQFDQGTGIVYV